MKANEPLPELVAEALPVEQVEPIGYFRQTLHPMRRAVKFMAWFGIVLGIVELAYPILSILGFPVRPSMIFPYAYLPSRGGAALHAVGVYIAQCLNAGLLVMASIACLLCWRVGRRALIFHAYAAIVLFSVEHFVNLYWSILNAPKGTSMTIWLRWLTMIPGPAINQLIFPVLTLIIFRDRIAREFFQQQPSD